jgi:alpha-beta hydrolase superfamily lysophospholipase
MMSRTTGGSRGGNVQQGDGELVTADGVRLVASWRRAEDGQVSPEAVVLVHGFAAHRTDEAVVAAADALARAGFDVLTYDSRGHGESEGLCTLGDHEQLDVAAAVERAAQTHDAVVVVGASMGAIATLRYASSADEVALRGVVAVSSPATWQAPRTLASLAAAGLTQTPPGRFIARKTMNVRLAKGWTRPTPPIELIAAIDKPVVLVHGHKDRFIRSREADVLARHAGGPVFLDLVAEMGHAFDERSRLPITTGVQWCLDADLEEDAAAPAAAG